MQEVGDGALCTFDSAVEAVNCALQIQRAFQSDPDFSLRIGIHVGDIVFRKTDIGYDVFGDGVNVSSRIQGEYVPTPYCYFTEDRLEKSLEIKKYGNIESAKKSTKKV